MNGTTKKLYRSRTDRMIWGVCGGLGEYFNLDSTLFRALFVLLALFNGIGLFLYVFMAIIIPDNTAKETLNSSTKEGAANLERRANDLGKKVEEFVGRTDGPGADGFRNRNLLGIFIVILGLMLLAGQFFPFYFSWLTREIIGALIIVFIGAYLIIKK